MKYKKAKDVKIGDYVYDCVSTKCIGEHYTVCEINPFITVKDGYMIEIHSKRNGVIATDLFSPEESVSAHNLFVTDNKVNVDIIKNEIKKLKELKKTVESL